MREIYGEEAADEMEAVLAIYPPSEVRVAWAASDGATARYLCTITPPSGMDARRVFVRVGLELALPHGYPEAGQAQVAFGELRGVDDSVAAALLCQLQEVVADELEGLPVVFRLVEMAKEELAEHSLPFGVCPICLCAFDDVDLEPIAPDATALGIAKAACWHTFHAACLANYAAHGPEARPFCAAMDVALFEPSSFADWLSTSAEELTCPVCRALVGADLVIEYGALVRAACSGRFDSLAVARYEWEAERGSAARTDEAQPVHADVGVVNVFGSVTTLNATSVAEAVAETAAEPANSSARRRAWPGTRATWGIGQ
ncbi:uncharacterized protein AMSG_03074 [Thecamonas trahens ATCC 50062]|uniref:RWD domain-containing protein n=1 Tax=Thecamonas trahens ATCC 50062 TaxID=461836 RepID=A0A0L0D2U5_THETB|nr:hypothetical protein AMSG_03074 [Thecamonas trahens ATCC 50062]KNC46637.1 hypothetical protein AMSG_03074 [Thecamonas trahens ATCC 50062]|eukprot:XP_013760410.1 hypothetical protein AMSG_03074 [Thecamonas trahens ATCC 50062]